MGAVVRAAQSWAKAAAQLSSQLNSLPLHRLTDKGREVSWEENCAAAFAQLHAALTTAPILALPDPGRSFIVDTDCSDVGLGAVLSQGGAGGERVVAYYIRSLSRPEHNY